MRILLAVPKDDEAMAIGKAFEQRGAEVTLVRTGRAAIARAAHDEHHVVLVMIAQFPDLPGLAVIARIRGLDLSSTLFAIAKDETTSRAAKRFCASILMPNRPDVLVDLIERLAGPITVPPRPEVSIATLKKKWRGVAA